MTWACNLGKTIQALASCVKLGAKKILIVCPGMLAAQWEREAQKFNIGTDTYYIGRLASGVPICGAFDRWILIATYGYASRNKELKNLDFDIVIIDESHALKNPTAVRTKKILGKGSFLHNASRVLLMTGTPVMNRPAELYIMLKTFCPELLGKYKSWPLFVRRYCGFAAKGATHTDELGAILKEFMLRRTKEQVLDQLPPVIEQTILIEGVKVPGDEYLSTIKRLVAEAKIPHIVEYVEDILQTVDKLILICYHRDTIKTLCEMFGKKSAVIYGGQENVLRERNLTMFKTDYECKILIGQINTIGFGVDGLQHVCDRIVFGELDWSPGVIDQAIARLQRYGQKNTVFVDYLIAKGTLDDQINSKLKWKRKVITELTEQENTLMAKPAKVAGLEEALHLIADLVASKVLAGLAGNNTQVTPTTTAKITSQFFDTKEDAERYKESVNAGLDDADGMGLVGGAPETPKQAAVDVNVVSDGVTNASVSTPVADAPPSEVTLQIVSDKIYALLEALENSGVPKNDAMDYYRNQIMNGLSATSVKALKQNELVKVNDKLDVINVDKLAANLKPQEDGI